SRVVLADDLVDDLAVVGDHCALKDVVFKVQIEELAFLVPVIGNQVEEVAGVHFGGIGGNLAGPVAAADHGNAIDVHVLAGHGTFDVATGFSGHVDDHAAGLHAGNHVLGNQYRRLAAEDLGGGDDDVGFRNLVLLSLLLLF